MLDKITWNYITKYKLFVFDMNTWNHIIVCKLFILRIITYNYDWLHMNAMIENAILETI